MVIIFNSSHARTCMRAHAHMHAHARTHTHTRMRAHTHVVPSSTLGGSAELYRSTHTRTHPHPLSQTILSVGVTVACYREEW